MKELTNLIIGPFENEGQFDAVKAFLQKNEIGYYSNTSINTSGCFIDKCYLNLFMSGSHKKFSIVPNDKMAVYLKYNRPPVQNKEFYTYWQFNDAFMLKKETTLSSKGFIEEERYNPFQNNRYDGIKVNNPLPIIHKDPNYTTSGQTPPASINVSKLQELYNLLNNPDQVDKRIKQCLEVLYGKELFVKPEIFYKFGDKFEHGSRIYTIVKIGQASCVLMDENFENFGLVKPVKDPNKITEAEFKELSGTYFDRLKLINK